MISSWEISDSTRKFILHPARADRISNEGWEKFTGENCFSIDIAALFFSGKGELFLSNFQVPTRFSTFPPRCCQHQFGCIKEKRRGDGEREETKIQLWIFYSTAEPNPTDLPAVGGCGEREGNKNLKTVEKFNFFRSTKVDSQLEILQSMHRSSKRHKNKIF